MEFRRSKTLIVEHKENKKIQVSVISSQLKAVVHCKCPKCRTGDMLVTGPLGRFPQKVNKLCPHCCFLFEIVPDYLFVARSLGWLLYTTVIAIVSTCIYLISPTSGFWVYIATTILFLVASSPFIFRYSHILLLYFLTQNIRIKIIEKVNRFCLKMTNTQAKCDLQT